MGMRIRTLIGWTAGTLLAASLIGHFFGWVGFAVAMVLGAVGLLWRLLERASHAETGGRYAAKVMEQRWKAERDVTPGL